MTTKDLRYTNYMEKPYLTQYCNLLFEWHSVGVNIDTASKSQQAALQELREKAIAQSGLTWDELTLISMCRKYRIFKKVNTYAHKIRNLF